jgi:hypothetical protein
MSSISYDWESYDMYKSPQRLSDFPAHFTMRMWEPKTPEQLNKGKAAGGKVRIVVTDLSSIKPLRQLVAELTHAKQSYSDHYIYTLSKISRQTWRNVIRFIGIPTPAIIRRLAEALKLDPDKLLKLRNEAFLLAHS